MKLMEPANSDSVELLAFINSLVSLNANPLGRADLLRQDLDLPGIPSANRRSGPTVVARTSFPDSMNDRIYQP
jgi:hypothetical protein